MENLTLQLNVILIPVSFLMTMLYIKPCRNLLTSFEGVPDSFSTRPGGKIPTPRQVFKAFSHWITPFFLNGFSDFVVI